MAESAKNSFKEYVNAAVMAGHQVVKVVTVHRVYDYGHSGESPGDRTKKVALRTVCVNDVELFPAKDPVEGP